MEYVYNNTYFKDFNLICFSQNTKKLAQCPYFEKTNRQFPLRCISSKASLALGSLVVMFHVIAINLMYCSMNVVEFLQ